MDIDKGKKRRKEDGNKDELSAEARLNQRHALKELDPTSSRPYGFWITMSTDGVFVKHRSAEQGGFSHSMLGFRDPKFVKKLKMATDRIAKHEKSRKITRGEFKEMMSGTMKNYLDSFKRGES